MFTSERRHPGRASSARSACGYFTDGARLLHVVALARGSRATALVEDCRTLDLYCASLLDLDRMRLTPVAFET